MENLTNNPRFNLVHTPNPNRTLYLIPDITFAFISMPKFRSISNPKLDPKCY